MMTLIKAKNLIGKMRKELDKYIIGQSQMKDALCRSVYKFLISDNPSHLLLVGDVGLGKTLATEVVQSVLKKNYCVISSHGNKVRLREMQVGKLEGTEDVTDADVIGDWNYFKLDKNNFEFDDKGFTQAFNKGLLLKYDIVLVQEINRIPYRSQNAILEVMSDKQVTISALGKTLKRKVLVIATMNDRDLDETYKLSRAFRDRFTTTLKVHYPSKTNELLIMRKYGFYPDNIFIPLELELFIIQFLHELRTNKDYVTVPPSPRGTLALLENCVLQTSITSKSKTPKLTVKDLRRVVVESLAGRLSISYKAKEESGFTTEYEAKEWVILKVFDQLVEKMKQDGKNALTEGVNPDFSEDKKENKDGMGQQNNFNVSREMLDKLTNNEKKTLKDMLPIMQNLSKFSKDDDTLNRTLRKMKRNNQLPDDFDLDKFLQQLSEDNILEKETLNNEDFYKKGSNFYNFLAYKIFMDSLGLYDKIGLHLHESKHFGRKTGTRKFRPGESIKVMNKRRSSKKRVKKDYLDIGDLVSNKFDDTTNTNVVIVLDISGSMKNKKLYTAKVVAAALARFAADYGDRVGIVVFSNHSKVLIRPTSSIMQICQKLAPLKADSCTNIVAGIEDAVKLIEDKGMVLVLSDGEANMLDEKWEGYIDHSEEGYHSFLYWRDRDIKFALGHIKGMHEKLDFFFIHISSDSNPAKYCKEYAQVTNGQYAFVRLDKRGDVIVKKYLTFKRAD